MGSVQMKYNADVHGAVVVTITEDTRSLNNPGRRKGKAHHYKLSLCVQTAPDTALGRPSASPRPATWRYTHMRRSSNRVKKHIEVNIKTKKVSTRSTQLQSAPIYSISKYRIRSRATNSHAPIIPVLTTTLVVLEDLVLQ